MSFLEQNHQESSNLNASIASSIPFPQTPSNNLSHDTQNLSHQQKPLPPVGPAPDNNVGPKSYFSSINNILPCSLENSINGIDKAFGKNNIKPAINTSNVAKGLSALHQKVDELLKKTSQVRAHEGTSPQKPVLADHCIQINPNKVFTLNAIQPETIESATTKSGLTIDITSNKHQEPSHCTNALNDERDYNCQFMSVKATTTTYQDFFMNEKPVMSSPQSESKATKSAFQVDIARNYSDTKPTYKQEQVLKATYQSPRREYTEEKMEEAKPKYDENKLEAIVARIKQRNSVSPAPRQRASVTPQEVYTPLGAGTTGGKVSWSTSRKNQNTFDDHKEAKAEVKSSAIPISWQLPNMTPDERSIDEIPNEKDVNVTGNTTILELFEKKKNAGNSKFKDDQPEEEHGNRTPPRSNRMMPGERKLRIAVPKENPVSGAPNQVPTGTVYLQDILKDLQVEKPLVIKESTKVRGHSAARPQAGHEKTKSMVVGHNFELKEKSLNADERSHHVKQREEEEGMKTRGRELFNQSPEVKKSSKYFAEEESVSDASLKQALRNAGFSATANSGTRQKSVDLCRGVDRGQRAIKNIFQIHKEDSETERTRTLEEEMKPQKFQNVNVHNVRGSVKGQSPPKKTEDDSLLLDDSVFSVKEGGVNTHRQININSLQDKSIAKENSIAKNELDTTVVRNRFLQEDVDISDFDFDKNRLDTLENYQASYKGKNDSIQKTNDSYLENLGVKRQNVIDEKTPSFGPHDRILPRSEQPKSGMRNRGF